ncbi:MAG: alpha/beta hydrolase [Clostridiaceae bacterium]|nr:alpha/beta hydrolase [Clostridiaceae bacterium]
MHQLVMIDDFSFVDPYLLDPITKPDKAPKNRPLLLILPGGGYRYLSPREGQPVALRANSEGFHALVLHYTVLTQKADLTLEELLAQVEFCLDWVDQNANTHHIDKTRVYICGFSAGGHLAAWSSIRFADRLARALIVYGAVGFKKEELEAIFHFESSGQGESRYTAEELEQGRDMIRLFEQAPAAALHANVPPTFLFHTMDDQVVPVTQSFEYGQRLHELNIPCELHFYCMGGHGLSLANASTAAHPEQDIPRIAGWFDIAVSWLKEY